MVISYALIAEEDDTRLDAYLASVGEDEPRALLRNMITLAFYGFWGGLDVDQLDAADPTWGRSRVRHPIVPAGWEAL